MTTESGSGKSCLLEISGFRGVLYKIRCTLPAKVVINPERIRFSRRTDSTHNNTLIS